MIDCLPSLCIDKCVCLTNSTSSRMNEWLCSLIFISHWKCARAERWNILWSAQVCKVTLTETWMILTTPLQVCPDWSDWSRDKEQHLWCTICFISKMNPACCADRLTKIRQSFCAIKSGRTLACRSCFEFCQSAYNARPFFESACKWWCLLYLASLQHWFSRLDMSSSRTDWFSVADSENIILIRRIPFVKSSKSMKCCLTSDFSWQKCTLCGSTSQNTRKNRFSRYRYHWVQSLFTPQLESLQWAVEYHKDAGRTAETRKHCSPEWKTRRTLMWFSLTFKCLAG